MLCGWGVNEGIACLQVKLCVATSERFGERIWYLKSLYKIIVQVYFTFNLSGYTGMQRADTPEQLR